MLLSESEVTGTCWSPPDRSSMWRAGFSVPANYGDNQLFCGGFSNQWETNDGKCGTCGDPYQGPLPNDSGEYDTGTIGAQYTQGQDIDVTIQLTANHLGYFTIKLCADGDLKRDALQTCLDNTVLKLITPSGVKEKNEIGSEVITGELTRKDLVLGLVLRNTSSTDLTLGSLSQENLPHSRSLLHPTPHRPPVPGGVCRATGVWEGLAGQDQWCVNNCAAGQCPPSFCVCN
ncbi:uncharacterized protein LOC124127189 [Haliotis rufescens]|uniref:uncharacterized protein LOC124127189 n=1 Tax=Haliotis rufescens TaxID=6454 RepID=UPI00201F13BC|nr:uncharacterized protein LOC124127189 [Haliotis rufescens]